MAIIIIYIKQCKYKDQKMESVVWILGLLPFMLNILFVSLEHQLSSNGDDILCVWFHSLHFKDNHSKLCHDVHTNDYDDVVDDTISSLKTFWSWPLVWIYLVQIMHILYDCVWGTIQCEAFLFWPLIKVYKSLVEHTLG